MRTGFLKVAFVSISSQSMLLIVEHQARIPRYYLLFMIVLRPPYEINFGIFLSYLRLSNFPWLLYGDFSCISSCSNKLGGKPFQVNNSVLAFQNYIYNCNLTDLSFFGSLFTCVIIDLANRGFQQLMNGFLYILMLLSNIFLTPSPIMPASLSSSNL